VVAAALWGNRHRYPLDWRLGGPESLYGHCRENSLPLPGVELQLPHRPAHSSVTIVTETHQLWTGLNRNKWEDCGEFLYFNEFANNKFSLIYTSTFDTVQSPRFFFEPQPFIDRFCFLHQVTVQSKEFHFVGPLGRAGL
jgi:hypothetical protein